MRPLYHGKTGHRFDLHVLCREIESHDADADASGYRLTNGFSKKAENHAHAVSLHFMFYNYCRSQLEAHEGGKGY
jgi:hypothetical protein